MFLSPDIRYQPLLRAVNSENNIGELTDTTRCFLREEKGRK